MYHHFFFLLRNVCVCHGITTSSFSSLQGIGTMCQTKACDWSFSLILDFSKPLSCCSLHCMWRGGLEWLNAHTHYLENQLVQSWSRSWRTNDTHCRKTDLCVVKSYNSVPDWPECGYILNCLCTADTSRWLIQSLISAVCSLNRSMHVMPATSCTHVAICVGELREKVCVCHVYMVAHQNWLSNRMLMTCVWSALQRPCHVLQLFR